MSYQALYRVWRPQKFQDIIGQTHVTHTLQNALKRQRYAHAYLFTGPRGTGKTSAAKVMAKAVNCEQGPTPEPCDACSACQQIAKGTVLDVVEIDAASNRGIEEIRDLRDQVKYAPTEVRMKVYIIDEVHMLTPEAFNALLKTLEEPPEHVLFILATTEPYKLPLTIISRCQRFDFHRVSVDDMVARLAFICEQEQIEMEETAFLAIAQASEGGMRDAISLLDQAYAFSEGCVTEADIRAIVGTVADSFFQNLLSLIAKRDAAGVLDAIEQPVQQGHDVEKLAEDLLHYVRDLLLVKTAPNLTETANRLKTYESLQSTAQLFTEAQIFVMMETINETHQQMKWTNQPFVLLQLLVVKLIQKPSMQPITPEHDLTSLLQRMAQLEAQVRQLSEKSAAPVSSQPESQSTASPIKLKPDKKDPQSHGRIQHVQTVREQADQTVLSKVKAQWSDILARVKQKKITVHAWLVDGECVAATDTDIVLAFKNKIHRETTEKPAHKQLIEGTIQEVLGVKMRLLTCMQEEWARLEVDGGEREQAAGDDAAQADHIQKALEWFGEDLVEIKDQ